MLVLDASRATADELPASHQLVTTWHRDIVRLFDKAERQHQHSVALQVFGGKPVPVLCTYGLYRAHCRVYKGFTGCFTAANRSLGARVSDGIQGVKGSGFGEFT